MLPKHLFNFLRLIILCAVTGGVQAQTVQNINSNWYYHQGDTTILSLSKQQLQAIGEPVQLPHTWNRADAFNKYKPMYKGVGWYYKFIKIDAASTDRVSLKFEGVLLFADVYVNGKLVTHHQGGYTAFIADITKQLKPGTENIIAIKADNKPTTVMAPLSGDFTRYGGIYRDVWLIKSGAVHFSANYGAQDIHITTPVVNALTAQIKISARVTNELYVKQKIKVKHTLYDPSGKEVAVHTTSFGLKAREQRIFTVQTKAIANPRLWHPDHPWLYKVRSEIITADNAVADGATNAVGLRWFKLTNDKGFFLNGQPLKLNGFCRHQDIEGLANALPNERHEQDMQLIKDMGGNFTRLAHYPQDKAVLDACDRLGILVWMETPNVDYVDTSATYASNSKTQQVEMIKQNYNHPSIVMWGFMNEILLGLNRRYPDTASQNKAIRQTQCMAKELAEETRRQDPDRLTTIAFHGSDQYNKLGLGNYTNAVGWNLYMGWYGNNFSGLDRFIDEQHKKYPDHPMIISEYGAGSDARINSLKPEQFDFSMQWQQKYIEYYLPVMQAREWLVGSSAWILADFGSEIREETMPRVNNKGIVFFNREKKDVFYYYQAFFQKNKPVLHIATRDWSDRKMQFRSNNDSTITNPIKVYSNGSTVELFCNGRSVGVKPVSNCLAEFEVPLKSGQNQLTAKATINGTQVTDNAMVNMGTYALEIAKQPSLSIGVNCGSNAWYHDTERNYIFEADQPYQKGSWGYIGGQVYRPIKDRIGIQAQIAQTDQDPLYQTLRTKPEGYQFDVAAGNYEVTLEFADPANAKNTLVNDIGTQSAQSKQQRIFSVSINGERVIAEMNIESEYGVRTLVQRTFKIRAVGDQGIKISFASLKGEPIINAIKVQQLP